MLEIFSVKALVALDGELAVPRYPKSAYAGLKILLEISDP